MQDIDSRHSVKEMFNRIAKNYDHTNYFISLGRAKKWQKNVIEIIQANNPKNILDIATGTGDMAIHVATHLKRKTIGIDISKNMLEVAQKKTHTLKINHVKFMEANAENLPFENQSFDAVMVGFGLRNFENLEQSLSEIHRVMRPNGLFVALETSTPNNFFYKHGYYFYLKYVLPTMGLIFSKNKNAYVYLANTAKRFPYGKQLNNILQESGFSNVCDFPQSKGVATIYTATK